MPEETAEKGLLPSPTPNFGIEILNLLNITHFGSEYVFWPQHVSGFSFRLGSGVMSINDYIFPAHC